MKEEPARSLRIAQRLREHDLHEWIGVLLSAARPLAVLGAQAAYILEPLVGGRNGWLRDFAILLEDPHELDALLDRLHEEDSEV